IAVFFARMVMPRSRSNSLESITLSACASLARQVPLWFSMASTSVVLPWSTCAMMAMLRRLELKNYSLVEARASYQGTISQLAEKCLQGTALYQGTTSVVPYRPHNQRALAPAQTCAHPSTRHNHSQTLAQNPGPFQRGNSRRERFSESIVYSTPPKKIHHRGTEDTETNDNKSTPSSPW